MKNQYQRWGSHQNLEIFLLIRLFFNSRNERRLRVLFVLAAEGLYPVRVREEAALIL